MLKKILYMVMACFPVMGFSEVGFYVALNPSYSQAKVSVKASNVIVNGVGPINAVNDVQLIQSTLSAQRSSKQKINAEFSLGYRAQMSSIFFESSFSFQPGTKRRLLGTLTDIKTSDIDLGGNPVESLTENVSVYLKAGASYGVSLRGGVEIFDQTNLFLGITTAVQLGRVYTQGSFVDDDVNATHPVNKSASYTSISFTPEIMVERTLDDQITGTFTLGYRNAVRRSISGNISGLTLGDRGLVAKVGLRYYF